MDCIASKRVLDDMLTHSWGMLMWRAGPSSVLSVGSPRIMDLQCRVLMGKCSVIESYRNGYENDGDECSFVPL